MDELNTPQHTAADLGLGEFLAAIDAAPDPETIDFPEIEETTAKGPRLPDLLVPQDHTAAMIALLADGHGSIPAFLRKHEPTAFDTGILTLTMNCFELELRGGTHYYLKAQHGPGSLSHLRELLEVDADAALYRDYCARELRALMDRLHHYELCRGITEQRARKAARAERKQAKLTASEKWSGA